MTNSTYLMFFSLLQSIVGHPMPLFYRLLKIVVIFPLLKLCCFGNLQIKRLSLKMNQSSNHSLVQENGWMVRARNNQHLELLWPLWLHVLRLQTQTKGQISKLHHLQEPAHPRARKQESLCLVQVQAARKKQKHKR